MFRFRWLVWPSTILLGKLGIDFYFLSTSNSASGQEILYLSFIIVQEDFYANSLVPNCSGTLPQKYKCNQLRMLGKEIQAWLYTWALHKTFGTWKGLNRVHPNPSTFHPSLKHGTNSYTASLTPKIHTVIHKTAPLCRKHTGFLLHTDSENKGQSLRFSPQRLRQD